MSSVSVRFFAQSKDEETISRVAEYISENFGGSLVNVQGGNMDAEFCTDSFFSEELFEDMPTSKDLEVRCIFTGSEDEEYIIFQNGIWV